MTAQKLMLAFALGTVVQMLAQIAYDSFTLAWRLVFGAGGAILILTAFYVGTKVGRPDLRKKEGKRENQDN